MEGGHGDPGWLRGTFERAHCGWLGRLVGVVGSVGVAGSGTQPTGGEEEGKEEGGLGKQELGMLACVVKEVRVKHYYREEKYESRRS